MNSKTTKILALAMSLEKGEFDQIMLELSKFLNQGESIKAITRREWVIKASIPIGPGSERGCPMCGK